jgi:endonuclease/exonuclease/phosphatase (EEP) superfamily protein YafD
MRIATRRRTLTATIDVLLLSAGLGVCVASALALAARSGWIAELFTHFRVQYIAAQVPLVFALLARRKRVAATIVAVLLVANAIAVAPYWPANASTLSRPADLTLMTVNLRASNDDSDRLIDLIREISPDAIVLLEVTPAWAQALTALERDYPASHLIARQDPFGIGLLSRVPITAVETLDLLGAPAIDARLAVAGAGALRLIGVHLWPPIAARLAQQRNAQLDELAGLVAGSTEPLAVTGDFNITPYAPRMSAWLEQTGLTDPRRGHGFAVSWPVSFPLLGIPIDHSFVNEHVMASEPRRSAAFGSDHYAITTSLSFRENQ